MHSSGAVAGMTRFSAVSLMLLVAFELHAAEPAFVFAPDQGEKRIVRLAVRDNNGQISVTTAVSIELPFAPAGIALSHNKQNLYVASGGRSDPQVASIELQDHGSLKLIETSSLTHSAGYTSVDRSGKFFLTVNYPSGLAAVYRINGDGAVGEIVCSLATPNKEAHCILTTPDNRFAYIPCVKNNNALFQFEFDARDGKLTPLKPFDAKPPAMFGPRHCAYHPTLPLVYFSNEQQLGVSVFRIASGGQLDDLQHAVTMPRRSPFEQGKRDLHASDLVIAPNGKRLFVAVRDFQGNEDSVLTFDVRDDGKLSLLARTRVGDIPWKVDLSPDGELLFVSASQDRKLGIFRVQADGRLTEAAEFDWKMSVRDMVILAH